MSLLKNLCFSKPRFVHKVLGYNFRMSGIQAALGLSHLEEIESIIRKKIKIVQEYKKQLKNLKPIIFAEEEENSRNEEEKITCNISYKSYDEVWHT